MLTHVFYPLLSTKRAKIQNVKQYMLYVFQFAIKYVLYGDILLFCLEMLLKYVVESALAVAKWLICRRLVCEVTV